MIFFTIGFLIIAYSFVNFHKAFLWYLIFRLFLVQNISVVNIPGVPLLTLDLLISLYFIVVFWQKRKKILCDTQSFPYKKAFTFIAVSYFFSSVFAYIGFIGAVSQYVKDIASNFLLVWLIWCLVSEKDIPFLFKWLTISFFFIALYGIYEHSVQMNPLQLYEQSLMGNSERMIDFSYDADSSRGYRVQSVFEHAIGGGMMFGLYIIFSLYQLLNGCMKVYTMQKIFSVTTMVLCFFCLLYTNSRGPIVFFALGLLGVLNLKNKKIITAALFGMFAMIVLFPFMEEICAKIFGDYFDNVLSIFDKSAQSRVGGSNKEMRLDQLDAAVTLMSMNPSFGLGYKFMNVMDGSLIRRLLGMESMWFRIFTTFGIFGFIANVYYSYCSIIKIPKFFKSKPVFFISLAYWLVGSMTSTPGYIMCIHYLVVIILLKQSSGYKHLIDKSRK